MVTILDIQKKYRGQLDHLDLELIISRAISKPREFVLTYPEKEISAKKETQIKKNIKRRIRCEPLAYITGEKEFYKMKYKVSKDVLIPRPETEMIVDLVLHKIENEKWNKKNKLIITDIGTGSGNIIVSITKNISRLKIGNSEFFGTDISKKALQVAKYNSRFYKLDKKIKFLKGNLLNPIILNSKLKIQNSTMIIVANLPYLSPKIYDSCSQDIRKYEPKLALISQKEGLEHYENLLKQIFKHKASGVKYQAFLEIGPEQKYKIKKIVKKYFPASKIIFHKDISRRWRVCQIEL